MSNKNNSSFWLLGGLAVLGIGAAVLLGGNTNTQQDTTSYGGGGSAGGMGGDVFGGDMPGTSGDVQYPNQATNPIVQYIPQVFYQPVPMQPQQDILPQQSYQAMEAYEAGLQLADSLNTDANNFAERGIIPTEVHYSWSESLGGGTAYATGTLTEEAQRNFVENLNNPTPAPIKLKEPTFASGESYYAFVNPNDTSQVYIAKKHTTSDAPSRSSSSGGSSSSSSSGGSSSSSSSTSSWSGGGGGKLSGVSSSGSLSGGGSFVDI